LLRLEVQKSLFLLALDRLGDTEPVNEALEVTLTPDGEVALDRYALPPS
jgi:hypothetical protein